MSVSTISIQATHPRYLDDEIVALTLQLEEINDREATKKAKYAADAVPDLEIAYVNYLHEIEAHLSFLKDVKLAHSIAHAVEVDGQEICEIVQSETQARDDHRVAVQLSNEDPELEAPPPYSAEMRQDYIEDEVIRQLTALTADLGLYDDAHTDDEDSGPSASYAQRQADALGKLAREDFQCTACANEFRWADLTQLECGDRYCIKCLKIFIMHAVVDKDLVYLPPRCHGKEVAYRLIVEVLSKEELEEYHSAQVEKATKDKTHCTRPDCGKFINPRHIVAGEATCEKCKAKSCAMCKNAYHEGDCPADVELQATLELASTEKWQRCFSCRELVEIKWGCNHMTCKCGAEFCYLCGMEWTNPRQCNCEFWIEGNLLRRAEQVVDRAAPRDLQPAERQRRIVQVQEQLRDTDECEHHGRRKFERIEGWGRRRFRCEMCDGRHRQFILRCRRCQLELCMDCRLHRV